MSMADALRQVGISEVTYYGLPDFFGPFIAGERAVRHLLQPCVLLLELAKPANVRHIEVPIALTVDGLLCSLTPWRLATPRADQGS